MRNLAISQITTAPLTLQEDIDLCLRLGAGLEIAEKKLSLDPGEADEQLAFIQGSGVRVTSIQPRTLTIFPSASDPEPAAPEARLDALMASVSRFSRYWPGVPLVTNTGAAGGDEAKVWDGCVEHYGALARHAQAQGMLIALEALGPSLMNRNSVLFSYSQAHEMAEQVHHPSFGVCLDLYNSWQDAGLLESICAQGLFLVQLADWRRPRSLHDRRALGQGRLPFGPLLEKLSTCGYHGNYVLEIFSEDVDDSLWADKATLVQAVEASAGIFGALRAGRQNA
ncbi:sugar phosphate isomerase/epimerase [Pseudomonas sp. S75]|uniref:sugar phosphate isomerase/epimerase family protein n=1 Tax=unclassified Pseudomonas TaxID=196821 RepID=UPI0019052D20|nr:MULTISPECIES: sugar phosphate isomerase/epimerase family protein [unclassified Pseudomonas]MBJ9977203.1 sugar phosphate isomerase/epimerase [Pseudomonas sp. S30]MBK0154205.1 sugar phosphate isomerase/epimerase [Pseudomonas sp. S75]